MNAEPHIHLHPADGLPMPRRVWAILAVAFGVSLSVIDGTIANVALPTIGQELGISSADSIWIVNAYQLAIMVSLLSFSALGDVVGYRKIYIGGLMLFTVASVACALSGSLQTLVLARVMQGFGAAAITSVNTTLIRFIYPKAQLGRGMGINATVVAVSSVAGPTLAAGILSVASWPWLFAVNIPMGLVALALSRRFLPENPVRVSAHRFDWRDAVMNALTFGLLMASVEGFSHGLDPRLLTLGVAALLVIGFFFIRSQLREPYPILPFDVSFDVPLEVRDFTLPAAREEAYEFAAGDLVVFGMPTYAGKLPNKLLEFVKSGFHGNGALAVPVVTFGNRSFDNSLAELCACLEGDGFHTIGAGAFACRHAFTDALANGRPDSDDMAELAKLGFAVVGRIVRMTEYPAPVTVDGGADAPYYRPLGLDGEPKVFLKAKPKTDLDKCIHCGVCASLCPMGSINPDDVTEIAGICIKCHSCVRNCPMGAKYFDDPAFLSHRAMLERDYTRRAEDKIFTA